MNDLVLIDINLSIVGACAHDEGIRGRDVVLNRDVFKDGGRLTVRRVEASAELQVAFIVEACPDGFAIRIRVISTSCSVRASEEETAEGIVGSGKPEAQSRGGRLSRPVPINPRPVHNG